MGDGVILQFADPDLIEWCVSFVKKGAEAAGRDPKKIEIMAATAVWVSDDLKEARSHVRWFPALVSNHVMDLISKYKPEELPARSRHMSEIEADMTTCSTAKSIAVTRISFRMKS